MDENHVDSTVTKMRKSAPLGNRNDLKHGVFSLEEKRKRGILDKRTSPVRAIKKNEHQIVTNRSEARKKWHTKKAAWMEYYADRLNDYLLTLKHIIRKGKVNPALDLLLRIGDSAGYDHEVLANIAQNEPKPLDLARKYQLEQLQSKGGK